MVNIAKLGDSAIKFTFTDNYRYLHNGEIEVPLNSLILVVDESDMVTFKKIDGDPFVSFLISDSNFESKETLIYFYKTSMVGGTGGSESGITSGDVESMIEASLEDYYDIDEIDAALSGKADTSAVTEAINSAVSGKADTSAVTEAITAAVSGKQDTLIAGSGITISGNVISAEGGNNVIELTQAEYDALVDKDPNAFYIITDATEINISDYYTSAQTQSAINAAVSGKPDTSAVTQEISAAVSGKQDTLIAGDNITISGNVISAQGGGSIDIDPSLDSGSTNAVANSAITNALNSKIQNFRTNSNSQTTIRLAITKNGWSYSDKDLLNLYNGLKTIGASGLTIDLNGNQEFKTYSAATDALLDDKFDASAFTSYSAATDARISEDEEVTAAALNALNDELSGKQDTLIAGSGITISGNVISAAGGGSITIDPSLDSGSTNAVANSAITAALNDKADKSVALRTYTFGTTSNKDYIRFQKADGSYLNDGTYYPRINGKSILSNNINAINNYELVETSAITSSVTSVSTDSQVPSAKAVYDKLGGLSLVKLTQAEYTALVTKDNNTLYVIVG